MATTTKLPSGILVRDSSNNKIYFIDNGTKRHITSEAALAGGSFVDIDPRSTETITHNLNELNLIEHSKVYRMDAQKFIGETPNNYDFIFLSPYYDEGLVTHILKSLCIILNDDGTIFYDHPKNLNIPTTFDGLDGSQLKVIDTRTFGATGVSILTKE